MSIVDPAGISGAIRSSDKYPNLDILTGGTRAPNPSELLGSERMKELISRMRERYDRIIIDSPPLLAFSDSLVLGSLADGVILVVWGGKTSRELIQKSLQLLQRHQHENPRRRPEQDRYDQEVLLLLPLLFLLLFRPERQGKETGKAKGMIDIHCHILPNMDDGPASLGESLAMCRAATRDGIRIIVATPHFKPGTYEFTRATILDNIKVLQAAVKQEGLNLTILPGAEVTVSPEMQTYLTPERGLTINGGRYFLVEFSSNSVPSQWDTFLLSFLASGMTPIIAHPERNAWFMTHPEALSAAVKNGILVQITAASLTGGFGEEAQDFSIRLLRRNLVHAIASDGHSADLRPPRLAEAVSLAAEVVGKEMARALVTSIPQAIILDRKIPAREPLAYRPPCDDRKSGWFKRLRAMSG